MTLMPGAVAATEEDWGTEYLDYILSIKTVSDIDEAIAHIAKYSTDHSESIITQNYEAAEKFIAEVMRFMQPLVLKISSSRQWQ